MWPFSSKPATPVAAKPTITQLDRVEDKLDWVIAKFAKVKSTSVGVADEDIADLKSKIQAATDAATALSVPAVAPVVAAPTVVPVVVADPTAATATAPAVRVR